jgi:peptide-methionine (S)-S-oxide reductase
MTGNNNHINKSGIETATFGAGCFWSVEAIFEQLRGVIKVISGFSGGHIKNPSYRELCTGITGHAEVCQIVYDTDFITFDELLEVFFLIHDPTSLNKQGNDNGTQYRSAIFYHNDFQKNEAEDYKNMLNASNQYSSEIVTEISPYTAFYKAEEYHQNYYSLNSKAPYCVYVIDPKIKKFRKVFKDKIKQKEPLN